jgi:hypothetical protein
MMHTRSPDLMAAAPCGSGGGGVFFGSIARQRMTKGSNP